MHLLRGCSFLGPVLLKKKLIREIPHKTDSFITCLKHFQNAILAQFTIISFVVKLLRFAMFTFGQN